MPTVRQHRTTEGIIGPVDYTARTRYRGTPGLYQRLQPLGWWLTRHGLSPAYVVTLEVPGRRSSIIRRTTLVQVVVGKQRFLVSLAGESDWVRNVRAAGGRAVLGRRERRAVTLQEVALGERPPVIQAYLARAGRTGRSWGRAAEARHYFGVSAQASSEEVAAVAQRYPVFRIADPGPADAECRSHRR
ncbi:nitroreductase/quinone reductase family protein [Amycolatopsis mongoliensis]|uniref:Nitroreductase/quinone reductase family protein n=1 Tax=Amycolatopsis mongoliensis TaxID=715475 RepID=A0A9Y2K161_9PSEU|nr:nitroreductase/quinone reductase family protein [Amycolatopsis sp. 4-36]WIY06664.1 nitroreductase/quinone reductase family protein [Amycolatopsis sp. 4-36]